MRLDIAAIEAAARRLHGIARQTPLLELAEVNDRLGARVFVKAECLQVTGSFKLRGAYNRIARMSAAERASGIVAYSSGNHAQGVAAAAGALGAKATILMPSDAPAVKRQRTEALGATVITFDRERTDRQALAEEIIERTGAVLVPPFDDHDVMAGQGTVGLEIAADLAALGLAADHVICPTGGGGLLSGIAVALADRSPGTRLWSAEPEGFDDMARSLAAGARVSNAPGATSVCDAILTQRPGALTFEVIRRLVAGGVTVSDRAAGHAMGTLFDAYRIVAEPGGAVAFAALEEGVPGHDGGVVVAVISGGNVERETFCRGVRGAF